MANTIAKAVGCVTRGHVLDVSPKRFSQALAAYDPQLYIEWNPKKLKGNGCWEIRRKPEFNSALDIVEFEGVSIVKVGPYENSMVHHIMDCAFLNYDQTVGLRKWTLGSTVMLLSGKILLSARPATGNKLTKKRA